MSEISPPTDSDPDSLLGERIVVRVTSPGRSEALPLEVLARAPVLDILPGLAAAMSLAAPQGETVPSFSLVTEAGTPLDPHESLARQGVRDGDLLGLKPGAPALSGAIEPEPEGRAFEAPPATVLSTPSSPGLRGPCLATPLGWVFELNEGVSRIGRSTPGQQPEIDLTVLDPECASSRLHAEVRQSGEAFLLVPFRTTNGTLLNGHFLEPGTPVTLQPGDRVEFGLEGVALVFFAPDQAVPVEFFQVPRHSDK
jgi:hypothetical protein